MYWFTNIQIILLNLALRKYQNLFTCEEEAINLAAINEMITKLCQVEVKLEQTTQLVMSSKDTNKTAHLFVI